jgi:hypothetical protein
MQKFFSSCPVPFLGISMTTQRLSQIIVTTEGNRNEQVNHSIDANGPVLPEKLEERLEKCR